MAGEYSRGESPLEVLYEIRDHAKGSISPPQTLQQGSGGAGGGRFLPYLYQLPVVKQIKDKWEGYKRLGAYRNKRMSLYVSQDGEHVAVTATNQVIILHKENDYMEPCGIFVGSDRATCFTCGAWCEPQGVLGVVDDLNTLYFIKSTGEEIGRLTKDHLKSSQPIVDLLVLEECNSSSSFLNRFRTFTADGLIYQIEGTESLGAPSCHIRNLDDFFTCKVPLQYDISCLDFHPKLSLVVLVSASNPQVKPRDDTGLYSLHVLHMVNGMELEVKCCSSQLKGYFSYSKGLELSVPKVVISPQGRLVATLDVRGCVNIFNLDCEKYSLTPCAFAVKQYKHMPDEVDEKKKSLDDIVDVNWWSGTILIVAKRSGCVTMYDVHCGVNVLQNGPLFCAPILKRAGNVEGLVFVLDGGSSSDEKVIPEKVRNLSMSSMELPIDAGNQIGTEQIYWKLSSLSQKSVSQMYSSLISKQDYQAALNFADRYLLDKDDVLKAQWLHSDYGMRAISMFLSKVKDTRFVLGECVDKVGPTEEAVKSLLSHGLHITNKYRFSDSEDDGSSSAWEFRLIRLQLLLHRDRMETFVGINMGRFSSQEYRNFRVISLAEAAITIAENGKIGALNLLLKRHPYSLSPHTLSILSAIPETIPVQSYDQLLPGSSAPGSPALREGDWVENKKMVSFLRRRFGSNSERMVQIGTENILKELTGFIWPSVNELTEWYKKRAMDIDQLSGQLDNCISLVEIACRKGLVQLQRFLEDISFLHQLIYSDTCDEDTILTIVGWEQLSDYEKFRMMLRGVNEATVVERLRTKAIPFMQTRLKSKHSESGLPRKEEINFEQRESYLVKWLKEIAAENKLEICLAVLERACDDSVDGFFYNEAEKIETAVDCLYLCTLTDRWTVMTTILSKLGQKPFKGKLAFAGKNMSPRQSPGTPKFSHQSSPFSSSGKRSKMESHEVDSSVKHIEDETDHLDEDVSDKLNKKIKVAEGHVEAGRLMEYYQVPKPMSFFLSANSEVKNVKQIIRLILSKFARRQPVKTDSDWTNMWRDLQYLQEKAFPFLDLEYNLVEFCRGLLKAARFSLARYYLTSLPTEKAENLVIQAAREYFFSASSLHSNEIWKAKDCLSLFPNSKLIQAESDIIDALTIKLPSLGVTILPVQFRQVRNPMEIITMVISSQNGAYLNVEELIEIAKLLGLNSPVDIAAVEEAVAREAAVAGDLQLAFNLCLVLAKKDHGPIWDLCAAIARGPHIDNMDMNSRKHLLGFALSHCDDESVGELLNAWKEADMLEQSEQLVTSTGASPPKFFFQGSPVQLPVYGHQETINLISGDIQNLPHLNVNDDQVLITNVTNILSKVSMDLPSEGGGMWESFLKENKKALLFVAVEIPWLLGLSEKEEYGKVSTSSKTFGSPSPLQMQAIVIILHWLAVNDLAPNDYLIANLAKVFMKSPVTEADDIRGCSILLNLNDALHGVEIIEEQMKRREDYEEIYSIMNIGLIYGSLNNGCIEFSNPEQRRKLLLDKFREKRASLSSDDKDQIDKVHSNFWHDWKAKLEKQKQRADEARAVENLMPGVESARFLSRDTEYIRKAIYSFIDTTKLEKKHILRKAVDLADKYGLHRLEMVLRFFACALVSEHWGNDDILAEISEFREDVVKHPRDVIYMVRSAVHPEIKGTNKKRLSYIYSILSACYLRLKKTKDPSLLSYQGSRHSHILQLDEYYKILEQECLRVSFIEELNFKNIAGLDDVNFNTFNTEVRNNINESTVDALAEMVRTFNRVYTDSMAKELLSWQAVYEYHVLSLLQALEDRNPTSSSCSPDEMETYIQEVQLKYDHSKRYFSYIREDILTVLGRYLILCIPRCSPKVLEESSWNKYLFNVLDFWIKLADDINETEELLIARSFSKCLNALRRLVMEDEVFANQGWSIIFYYVGLGSKAILKLEILNFFKYMIFSGCDFKQISKLFTIAGNLELCTPHGELDDILNLYSYMMDDLMVDSRKYWNGKHGMQLLVSSLSRWEDDYAENLKMVRNKIWEKLQALSNDIKLEGHVRVYALELMQGITGRNLRNLPEELAFVVDRWEAWDESCFTKTTASEEDLLGGTDNLLSSLAALKSTQLVSEISPDIRITSSDLSTVDSAVSCFANLSNKVMSLLNLKILISVLEEWEKVFTSATEVKNKPSEEDYWVADDWDAGWENLPEEPSKKEDKYASRSPHPLHSCWSELTRKLTEFSDPTTILELLDRSFSNPNGLLLTEEEAQSLCQLLARSDCILSLKIALLLPYEGPRSQSLHLLEAKLAKDGITGSLASNDYDLLATFLFSGLIGDITSNSAFGKVFSYLCYLVGHTAHLCEEDTLRGGRDGSRRKKLLIFSRIFFPIFISELVSTKHYLLAGFMVSKLMSMPASIHLIDVVEPCLRRFFQVHMLRAPAVIADPEIDSYGSLPHSVSYLKSKLMNMLQTALSDLPVDTSN